VSSVSNRIFAALSATLLGALCAAIEPRTALAQGPAAQTGTAAGAQGPVTGARGDTAAGNAQQSEASAAEAARGTRVPLAQDSTAFDGAGREALSATLSTQALAGTPEAPARNARFVFRNAGQTFYNYVTGFATFYDETGTRCGSGLFTFEAAAPGERVETDAPGLRLTCTPVAWRVVVTTLLTPSGDAAQARPAAPATSPAPTTQTEPAAAITPTSFPPLEINVNGKTIPVQLGNPLEVVVGNERVRIVVSPAP
jgi:hypothetical protein